MIVARKLLVKVTCSMIFNNQKKVGDSRVNAKNTQDNWNKKTIKQSVPVRAKNDKVPIKKVPMISFLDV